MRQLSVVLALGRIAHDTFIVTCDARRSHYPFAHGRAHPMGTITLFDSYHCSRYNTNTGVLTPPMFRDVFAKVREHLDRVDRVSAIIPIRHARPCAGHPA